MRSTERSIKNIDFGLAAAEEERTTRPELLLEGFFDAFGYVDQVMTGSKFLILGPKGSGKSAIASRIELLSKLKEKLFVSSYPLGTFPYDSFTGLLPGAEAPEIRFPSHWELLLLVALIESFNKDPGSSSSGKPTHREVAAALTKLGLLPSTDFTQLVKQTTSKQFKLGIPQVFQFGATSEAERGPADTRLLLRTLQDVCYKTRVSGTHLLFVDGLDDVLTRRGKQYDALAALVVAADRMNRRLRDSGVAARIVVLCRTDLFDRLRPE